jgi:ubiquinone/menaquinone biosynthesis C-methylase UbiE
MDKVTEKNLLKTVRDGYEKIAGDYNNTRNKFHTPLFDNLVQFADEVKDGQKVLDVGCGNGKLIDLFSGKKIDYLGVDNNEAMLIFARQKYPAYYFAKADLLDLGKISEHNFDFVFCAAVLPHIPGADLRIVALKQLKNKISDNGKIIITGWNMWAQKKFRGKILKYALLKLIGKNKMDFGDILFDWKNSQGDAVAQRYYHAFMKGQLKKIGRKAGLKVEKLYRDKYNYYLVLAK